MEWNHDAIPKLAKCLEAHDKNIIRFLEGEKIARQYAIDKGVELQRDNFNLRQALNDARAWGVHSMGFSAQQSGALARWIDTGMVGAPPPVPDYYPKSALPNV